MSKSSMQELKEQHMLSPVYISPCDIMNQSTDCISSTVVTFSCYLFLTGIIHSAVSCW